VHERGLHVHPQQHTKPDQVDAQLLGHRGQQRHHDERQLKEVQEERQEEDHDVHHDQEAQLATWQGRQQVFHPQEPSTPWNTRLNTVEPTRMNTTKHDSLVVV
jgi:hypothetical protein